MDNAHAGGMFIGVNDLGELNDEAFTEFGKRYKEHPDTHTVFKGYKLNFVPELIKTAKLDKVVKLVSHGNTSPFC